MSLAGGERGVALEVASAAVAGQPLDDALEWFEEHGFKRRVGLAPARLTRGVSGAG